MNYSGYFKDSEGNIYYPRNMQRITTGTEYETDRMIDGKKVYVKRINCGALPNSDGKDVGTGINFSLCSLVDYKIILSTNSNYILQENLSDVRIVISKEWNTIQIVTQSNRSDYNLIIELYFIVN